jgi:hypothetical protein
MFGVEPKFPYVLGSDGAGTVEDSSPDSLLGDFAVPVERDASVEAW